MHNHCIIYRSFPYIENHVLDNVIRITLFCDENMVKQYLKETRDHSLFNIATPNAACYSY